MSFKCVHMWYIYSVKSRREITHMWILSHLKNGSSQTIVRKRKRSSRYIYSIEVRVFYPFDASIWVAYIHTLHTHTLNFKLIWWIMLVDREEREKKKYPSTNFKISDKLYAQASVIGLELHKTSKLPTQWCFGVCSICDFFSLSFE